MLNRLFELLKLYSLKQAKKQNPYFSMERLREIVPDISDQYTDLKIDTEYLELNVRAMHSFQVYLLRYYLLKKRDIKKKQWVVDVGDSSGNHSLYFKACFTDWDFQIISANIDKEAVEKIRSKGLNAVQKTAEKLYPAGHIVTMFQVMEHLGNPIGLLKQYRKDNVKAIILTVPYVRKTQVLSNYDEGKTQENLHIFEFSPGDWHKIFRYTGYKIVKEDIYYQYPKGVFSWFWKWFWTRFDYEGFYGVILEKGQNRHGGETKL